MDLPALRWVRQSLGADARAAFLRTPIEDGLSAATFDLDLMVFADVEGFRPQRLWAPDGTPIDLAWYPEKLLAAPQTLAESGLAAHRFQSAELLWDDSGQAFACRQAFDRVVHDPVVQARRVAVFLDIGYLTVREIGVTWDFPALARFWLQMAHAACVAMLADALRIACPNVFTRPFGHVAEIERATGLSIRDGMVRTLRLDASPPASVEPLRRIHRVVAARYAQPPWPASMRRATRAEYAYTLPAAELEWRIAVALEMAQRGCPEAAVFYLRFWAYSLARLPMVWQRAAEGQDIAFLRPERPVRPELERHCPEILDDLTAILGQSVDGEDVRQGLADLAQLRSAALHGLASRGITPADTRDWQPYQPRPRN